MLRSAIIPDSVTNIGSFAFLGCKSLESLTLPGGITEFDDYVFGWCDHLRTLTFDQTKLEGIHDGAFLHCSALENFNLQLPNTSELFDLGIGGFCLQ